MPIIKLYFEGQDTDAATAEIETFLAEQFGQVPRRVSSPPQNAEDRRGVSLALIALLVALPGSAVNTMTLAERLKLKERVQALIAHAKRLKAKGTTIRVDVDGQLKELATMTDDHVIDAADRARDDIA